MQLDSHFISKHHTTHLPSNFFDGCTLWSLHLSFSIRHCATPILWTCHSFSHQPHTVLLSPTCTRPSFPITHQWRLTVPQAPLTVPPILISTFFHENPLSDMRCCFALYITCHQLPLVHCSVCCMSAILALHQPLHRPVFYTLKISSHICHCIIWASVPLSFIPAPDLQLSLSSWASLLHFSTLWLCHVVFHRTATHFCLVGAFGSSTHMPCTSPFT